MNIQKTLFKLVKRKEGYHLEDIKIRKDNDTGELVAFIAEIKRVGEFSFVGKEIDSRDSSHVIRWKGTPKPAGRGFARDYLEKEDWIRYGTIYQRENVFADYLPEEKYDENKIYSVEDLLDLMARINLNYKEKNKNVRERE